jgi:PBP1b-binding outer membrane lipoprotein LpoB
MNYRHHIGIGLVLGTALVLTGCASYYMVKDPASGTEYYTTKVKKSHNAVVFTDAKTSADVTLQSSQVLEITKDQYDAAVKPH